MTAIVLIVGAVVACSGSRSDELGLADAGDAGGDAQTGGADAGELTDAGQLDADPLDAGETDVQADAARDASDASAAGDVTLSNIPADQLPQPVAMDLRIANECSFDSEGGSFECPGLDDHDGEFSFAIVEPQPGSRYAIVRTRSLQVDEGGSILVRGPLPLVIVTDQALRVFGRISAAAAKGQAYAGGFGPNGSGEVGNGPGAGQRGTSGQFRPSSGGSHCGIGGRGASPDANPGAAGGAVYGDLSLVPLRGGSSGGGPEAGAGGGALHLVSATELQVGVAGRVDAGGGGARNTSSGGGSGGALLLEAPRVIVEGILAANGGGGSASVGGAGGQDGRPDTTAAAGELGTLGGSGSALDTTAGTDGLFETQNRALGGGGGAGRIRINTGDGRAEITGTLSPSIASTCASVGQLPGGSEPPS